MGARPLLPGAAPGPLPFLAWMLLMWLLMMERCESPRVLLAARREENPQMLLIEWEQHLDMTLAIDETITQYVWMARCRAASNVGGG